MLGFKQYLHNILSEQVELPDEVLSGFTHEVNTKKSSSRRVVITVKSGDRDNDRDEILRRLTQAGFKLQLEEVLLVLTQLMVFMMVKILG